MLGKVYLALDSFLVDRAEDIVKIWNWTTGKTRADLANLLSGIHLATYPLEGYLRGDYGSAGFMGAYATILLSLFYLANKDKDRREAAATEREVMDLNIEKTNKNLKLVGGVGSGIFAGRVALLPANAQYADAFERFWNPVQTTTFAGFVGSFYIMRTPYVKPGKHCLAKAKDKLEEIIARSQVKPVMLPNQ